MHLVILFLSLLLAFCYYLLLCFCFVFYRFADDGDDINSDDKILSGSSFAGH